ncbi:MAG: PilC/PilY family type IV pilus protein [Pseudomonas profundi]|uniref:pilus assembly protein n=1 Tax=Pseudomonas profundi TaxID=1981513 RepID=UPI0030012A19
MKFSYHIGKTAINAAILGLCLQAATSHGAVSQQPLMLVESVAPNLIFTLDSSGSMNWAFSPDSIGTKNNSIRNTRRAKSSTFNPLYYNHEVTYRLPVELNDDGTVSSSGYSTSFNNAYNNGYNTGNGTVDLRDNYRVTWNWDISASNPSYSFSCGYWDPKAPCYLSYGGENGDIYRLAENPGSDFYASGRGGYDNRQTGVPAYYYVYDESRSGCNKSIDNDSCYRKVNVGTNERQNFAIWYSFYRTRALATLTAANLAFNDLPSSIRFSWQDLDRCKLNSSNCNNNYFRAFTDRHKGNFFKWLSEVKFDTGTPLRKALDDAGKFLQTNDAWAFDPNPMTASGGVGSTERNPQFSCRPSFHVMMSDGMWNGADGSPSGTLRADHSSFSLPGTGDYTSSRRPFGDSTTNTLADLAMHYWATDLSSLDDDLEPYMPFKGPNENWDPRNNPATWQHMVNYTMGLGLSQSLRKNGLRWEGDTFSGGYQNLLSGAQSWPPAAVDGEDNANNVYDLWHAAINSRGEFFSVDRPEDMIAAFNDIINRIAERTATAAAAGATTSVIADDPDDLFSFSTESRAFFPEYNSEDWSGDVKHAVIKRFPDGSHTRTQVWSARTAIDQQSNRHIFMGGGAATNGLQVFSYANLDTDLKTIFNQNPDSLNNATDNLGSDRVDYLKGDRSKEGNGDSQFRRRSSVLGDIINATPVVVSEPGYIPYIADKIDGESGDYAEFKDARIDRPELIYVGANDGMLHALSTEDGREVFAFVPNVLLKHMPRLTGQTYQGGGHRFFVDGTPLVRDVYIGDQWRTVLIGTLAAGGKSIFALDITDPGDNGAGTKLLWEISDATDDYENLGYSFPEPEIVRLHSGEWAVLQGNGYDSTEGAASMFIIDIADGSLIKELVVDEGEDDANGLSSVRGADNNGDGIVDYAYAGDLRGNLWRFDLVETSPEEPDGDPFSKERQSAVSAATYAISYGGNPLYTAVYPDSRLQSITAPPSLVRHPTLRGYMVLFGTGKYFETDDAAPDTSKANTVYGVWDRLTRAQTTGAADAGNLTRSNLQQQRIREETVTSFEDDDDRIVSRNVRYITDNPIQWYTDGTAPEQEANRSRVRTWGWYVDLEVGSTKKGEMMIQRMSARGNTLLFGTLTPNEDPCADGATYWAYGINSQTGARTKHPTFDFNQDGRHDDGDTDNGDAPGGYETSSPPTLTRDGSIIDVDGVVGFSSSPELQGRQSWQTIPLEIEE